VALRLDGSDPDFETRFAALLSAKRETAEDVETAVRRMRSHLTAIADWMPR